jgi:coproporphyrinogen III oxidase-like Fe-S oxidoreductase
VVDVERATPDMQAGERLMMGLRLVDGLPEAEIDAILALGERGAARARAIARAVDDGRMERVDGQLRFTERGMMTANATLADLV